MANKSWLRRVAPGIGMLAAALLAGVSAPRAQQNAGEAPYGLGMIPPQESDYARYPVVKMNLRDAEPTPDHFTLEDYLPPIGNQGHTGSCVGWSTAYYCYSISVAKQRKLTPEERQDPRFLFSPGWIWDQYYDGKPDHGMQIFQAFDVLEKMGCAPLTEYPWKEKARPWQPSDVAKKKAEYYKARKTLVLFKGAKAGDPANPEKMRHWLYENKLPIVLGIPIYKDFPMQPEPENYVYQKSPSEQRLDGYHAICIIGYDKGLHAFMMVNSWGEGWGYHGKLWLSEKFLTDYAIQGCVQSPGGPRLRDYSIVPAAGQ